MGKYFVVFPGGEVAAAEKYLHEFDGKLIESPFVYNSGTNPHFLTVDEIRNYVDELIEKRK
jgi:UDP-N-acetylglucosamine 4,6-dehydratase